MASALSTSSQKLVQEIYDQFLICKICFETYKKPKTLVCLHIFCSDCLERQLDVEVARSYRYMLYSRTIACPLCRKKTELPSGGVRKLPDNFLISNLIDIVNRRRGTGNAPLCEICKPGSYHSGKEAVSKCLECGKMLCSGCVDLHRRTYVTKSHSLIDTQVEKSIACKVHQDEVVRFYCEPCEMCICILCTFQEHKGHDVQSFSEGLKKHQTCLDTLVTSCRDRISCVKDHLDMIRACENEIRQAEDNIRDTTIESISAIRKNEKQMVEELYDFYGEDTLQFLKEKNVLQDILDNLTSSCGLTEIILKDKSIELLLLRREIQDKLEMLLQGQVQAPPQNLTRQVRIQPGYVALGQLSLSGSSERTKELQILGNFSNADAQTDIMMGELPNAPMSNSGNNNGCDESGSGGRKPPEMDDRCVNTCLPDLQNTVTMTDPVRLEKTSVQTDFTPMAEKGISTEVEVWSQWTNTPSVNIMDRSTLTTMTESKDHQTETVGLIDFVSTLSGSELPYLQTTGTLTDYPSVRSKSTNTAARQQCNKKTSTVRNLMLEKFTVTDKIHTYDFGVMTRIPGSDKAVGTKTTVYTDACEGGGDVMLKTTDVGTDAIWPGIRRVRHKSTLTMNELLYSTQKTIPVNCVDRGCSPVPYDIIERMPTTTKRKLSLEPEGSKRICYEQELPKKESQNCETQTDLSLSTTENIHISSHEPVPASLETSKDKSDKGTTMGSCVRVTDVSSGTVEVRRLERALNPRSLSFDESRLTPIKMKDKCTSTFVQTTEQATYMIQPVILSTGTNTPMVHTSEKGMETKIAMREAWTSPIHKEILQIERCEDALEASPVKRNTHPQFPVTDTGRDQIDGDTVKPSLSKSIMDKGNMVESGTQMDMPGYADKSAMTEKAITAPRTRHAMTATTTVILTDVGTSTPEKKIVDRESSPYRTRTFERHTSPIKIVTLHKGLSTNIKIPSAEKSTATFKLELKNTSTGTPIINVKDRGSSPIPTPHQDQSTSITLSTNTTGTATEKVKLNHAMTTTQHSVHSKDKTTMSVKFPGKNKSNMATPVVSTKDCQTIATPVSEKACATIPPSARDAGTEMAHVQYYEKETSTPVINVMHKNMATENISMADKQTATHDVTAAYRDLIEPRGNNAVTVSRGTCTTGPGRSFMVDRETSPIKCLPFSAEKATDPIRKIYVNKGVSVTQADLMCPVDKFQRVGQGRPRILPKNMPKEEPDPKFQPSMTTIQELSSDEECASPMIHQRILGKGTITGDASRLDELNPTHKERLWVTANGPSTRDMGAQSTFSANGSTQTTSILCKVETGTSTPPVETEDKAMCTESLSVDGKITECISKLRTVSKRLESQTTSINLPESSATSPIYSKADSTNKEAVMTQATSSPVVSGLLATKERIKESEGLAPLPNISKASRGSRRGATESACQPYPARRELYSIDSEMADGSGCGNVNDIGNNNGRSKARKQRLDITQLLHRPPGSLGGFGGMSYTGGSPRAPHRPSALGPRLKILDESARSMDPAHRRLQAKMSAIESPEDECPPSVFNKDTDSASDSLSSLKQRSEKPRLESMLGSSSKGQGSPKIFRQDQKVQSKSPMVRRKDGTKERLSKSRSPPKQSERQEAAATADQGACCGLTGSSKCPQGYNPSPKPPRRKRETLSKLPKRPSSASSTSSTSSASTEEGNGPSVRGGGESSRRRAKKGHRLT